MAKTMGQISFNLKVTVMRKNPKTPTLRAFCEMVIILMFLVLVSHHGDFHMKTSDGPTARPTATCIKYRQTGDFRSCTT